MADLFVELFSEEIPARMQLRAIDDLQKLLEAALKKEGFAFKACKNFVTPRRMALWCKDLPKELPASTTEIKGPKTSAPEQALAGFLKKNNLTKDDLTERDGIFYASATTEARSGSDVIKPIVEQILASFPWPKSMRWGFGTQSWVRPLHSIICLLDGDIIPVSFAGVTASNITYGHRFLSPDAITISDPAQYESALESAHIIADHTKRKARILQGAQNAAADAKLTLKEDAALLDEVTGLVEWPVVLTGTIDAAFMQLPSEVLVLEMRNHQKYFALQNTDGTLADKFLITANIPANDGGKAIINGNERVLRARLADGQFFWDQDRKRTLEEWATELHAVTYHAKLGSMAEKVERIETLAASLAQHVSGADQKLVSQAARLCKADLVTGMVGEFPELQGIMGEYYATAQNENASVAAAIAQHYKPQGPSDSVPTDPVAICIALADKLYTIIGLFSIDEKPTGSKDPFALRRMALGIIRIILDNDVRLPLQKVIVTEFDKSSEKEAEEKVQSTLLQMLEALGKNAAENLLSGKINLEETVDAVKGSHSNDRALKIINNSISVLAFLIDRLKVMLKDKGIRHDVIDAVTSGGDDDLVRIVNIARAVQDGIASDDGENLLAAYKRAANILTIEQKKDTTTFSADDLNAASLQEPAEKTLAAALQKIAPDLKKHMQAEAFTDAMNLLATLRAPIDQFFNDIMVNASDADLRKQRLCLLATFCKNVDNIANFSLIETDNKDSKKKAA